MVTLSGTNIDLRALEPEDLDFIYYIENNETFWELSTTQTPVSYTHLTLPTTPYV